MFLILWYRGQKAQDIGRTVYKVVRAVAPSSTSMCRRSIQVDCFVERACVTLATGFRVFDGTRKDKETLRVELVETPARTNAKGGQYELTSESVRVQMPKTRVVELLAL